MTVFAQGYQVPRFGWQRKSLALDPATHPRILGKLIQDTYYPTPVGARRALAQNPSTPKGTLAVLARDEDAKVRRIVAANSRTPVGALQILVHDVVPGVKGAVADNASDAEALEISSTVVSTLPANGIPRRAPEAVAAILHDGAASLVRKDYNWFLRDEMPSDVLAVLAHSPNSRVRAAVAASRKVDNATCELLAFDDSPQVLAAVAGNHGGSLEIQNLLADLIWESSGEFAPPTFIAQFRDVAFQLAMNNNTSSNVLALLAQHFDTLVREYVAKNPNVGSDTLSTLADDNIIDVLLNVAQNENTRSATLSHLVARRPRSRDLQYVGPLLMEGFVMTREDAIAVSKPDFARSYSGYDWSTVLNSIAKHPNTLPSDLIALAKDGYRDEVARNLHTPAWLLKELAQQARKRPGYDEHDNWVDENSLLRAIAANPSTPTSTLEELFQAVGGDSYVGQAIAGNPSSPSALLFKIAQASPYYDSDTRVALVKNSATPPEALAILEKGSGQFVLELLSYRRNHDAREQRKLDLS